MKQIMVKAFTFDHLRREKGGEPFLECSLFKCHDYQLASFNKCDWTLINWGDTARMYINGVFEIVGIDGDGHNDVRIQITDGVITGRMEGNIFGYPEIPNVVSTLVWLPMVVDQQLLPEDVSEYYPKRTNGDFGRGISKYCSSIARSHGVVIVNDIDSLGVDRVVGIKGFELELLPRQGPALYCVEFHPIVKLLNIRTGICIYAISEIQYLKIINDKWPCATTILFERTGGSKFVSFWNDKLGNISFRMNNRMVSGLQKMEEIVGQRYCGQRVGHEALNHILKKINIIVPVFMAAGKFWDANIKNLSDYKAFI